MLNLNSDIWVDLDETENLRFGVYLFGSLYIYLEFITEYLYYTKLHKSVSGSA